MIFGSAHAQRGQTLPVWTFGSLAVLLLLFYMLDYSNAMRWQIRAQNAADAAAAGALSIQATQWNQMLINLHASAIEEYRMRRTLDAMLLTLNGRGGCTSSNMPYPTATASTDCAAIYEHLRTSYLASLQRYTNDVLTQQAAAPMSPSDLQIEMKNVLVEFQKNACSGNAANGGDCAFQYSLARAQPRRNSFLEDVLMDSSALMVGGDTVAAAKDDLTPMEIEVVACANVQPLIPNFFYLNAGNFRVVGRSAATTMEVTQEWMDPGHYTNPITNQLFQPTEYPDSSTMATPVFNGNNYDWYSVEYGGNKAKAFPKQEAYVVTLNNDEYSEWIGWWSSIPIAPFGGPLQAGVDYTCK